MRRVLVVALMMLTFIVAGCSKEEAAPPRKGVAAPDFTLMDLTGKQVRLSDYRGKVVLLNFWATWCPPCREEMPSMVRLNQIMAGKPFQMLAVSIDDAGKVAVEAYLQKSGTVLPVLLDTEQNAGKLYGITGVPETFVIDKKGVILEKVVGGSDWSAPNVVKFLEEQTKK